LMARHANMGGTSTDTVRGVGNYGARLRPRKEIMIQLYTGTKLEELFHYTLTPFYSCVIFTVFMIPL
jgi:hypothetical protein